MNTIIVTGTSRGLGKSIATKLSANSDLNIATVSRSGYNFRQDNYMHYVADITHPLERTIFLHAVIEEFKTIDILINNAGIVNLKSLLNYTEEDYEDIFAINVSGTFFLTQLCILHMLTQRDGGHIINIGSTRAITGAPDKSLYSMSKFALRSMTQCINSEFNEKGVYSTIICPGKFDDIIIYETVNTIEFLIKNNIKTIPEIIIGGKL